MAGLMVVPDAFCELFFTYCTDDIPSAVISALIIRTLNLNNNTKPWKSISVHFEMWFEGEMVPRAMK